MRYAVGKEDIMNEEKLSELSNEISQLKDLFVRRLYEDKNTKIAVEALVNQNEILNNRIYGRDIDSIVNDLILICDRIESNSNCDDFSYSIRDEIIEIFARNGISRIEANEMDNFNPKFHKVVKVIAADEKYLHGVIVYVIRNGYAFGDRVLRHAEVVVASDNK